MNTQLCAGSINSQINRDTCQGDRFDFNVSLITEKDLMNYSGGPLMTRTTDGLWELVGITSYGKGCGRLNELGVYTRVSMYLNWINTTIKKLEEYTSRSFDKLDNVFLNSAHIFHNYLFIVCYLIVLKINKISFYL